MQSSRSKRIRAVTGEYYKITPCPGYVAAEFYNERTLYCKYRNDEGIIGEMV